VLTERFTTAPAQLETGRILLRAGGTRNASHHLGRTLERMHDLPRATEIAIFRHPNFGPGFGKRQLAETTLRVLVEDMRLDTSLNQQSSQDVRIRQVGGAIEFFHGGYGQCYDHLTAEGATCTLRILPGKLPGAIVPSGL